MAQSSDAALAEAQAAFANLVQLPIPHIYVNGYTNNLSATEINSVLEFGPRPLAMVSMSLSFAKTYALALQELVSKYEEATSSTVPLLDEVKYR